LLPDILFHPEGKVVDENFMLLQDQPKDQQNKRSSFFFEIQDERLDEYFSFD